MLGDAAKPLPSAGLVKGLRARLEDGAVKLPVLPEVATRVVALTSDPRTTAAQLSQLVHRDPALAANVMKLVNSPVYGGAVKVVSLQQAVARLGMAALRDAVLAVSVRGAAFDTPLERPRVAALWTRSLVAALAAKEIARKGRRNVETAFLCGLLHEIGTPALLQAASVWLKEQAADPAEVDFDALTQALSVPYGQRLAALWCMPSPVVSSLTHYAAPSAATRDRDAVAVTCLAVALARMFLLSEEKQRAAAEQALRDHDVLETLNLYPDDVDDLLGMGAALVESASTLT